MMSTQTIEQIKKEEGGFTLVEMIVAVALFAVIMIVSVGTLLALTAANKRAQALQSVMNNLNISLDSMVRNIRMGREYYCSKGPLGTGTQNCNGRVALYFNCNTAIPGCSSGDRWGYVFMCGGGIATATDCPLGEGYIGKYNSATGKTERITSSDVSITRLAFYVVGADSSDSVQPRVITEVEGQVGDGSPRTSTEFHIQTTAVQRELDL